MSRIVIIGNSGGGKSTLARKLSEQSGLRSFEIDRLLWRPGWVLTPEDVYERRHDRIIASDAWIIDGLGRQASIPRRLARASAIVLVDMPLWMHFWLAAERQAAWATGTLEQRPGGIVDGPPTEALFRTIWEVEQTWMPEIRRLCVEAEQAGKPVARLNSVDDLTAVDAAQLCRRLAGGAPEALG